MKLTFAQKKCMKQPFDDGGEIIMRGIDQTEPCPHRKTVKSLVELGLLVPYAHRQIGFSIGLNDYFKTTDLAKSMKQSFN